MPLPMPTASVGSAAAIRPIGIAHRISVYMT